jgi:hypothetical protein
VKSNHYRGTWENVGVCGARCRSRCGSTCGDKTATKARAKTSPLRRTFRVGLLAGSAYAVWRWYRSSAPQSDAGDGWSSQPFPYPPVPRGAPETEDETPSVAPWMEPVQGFCPASHPVKAKLASGIYHLPGGASYERTKPDRCYLDAAAAEADGLRPTKR